MLILNRRFRVHCGEINAPFLEGIMSKYRISVISMKPHATKLGNHDLCSVFYECSADKNDFDKFVEHLDQHVKFIVSITY